MSDQPQFSEGDIVRTPPMGVKKKLGSQPKDHHDREGEVINEHEGWWDLEGRVATVLVDGNAFAWHEEDLELVEGADNKTIRVSKGEEVLYDNRVWKIISLPEDVPYVFLECDNEIEKAKLSELSKVAEIPVDSINSHKVHYNREKERFEIGCIVVDPEKVMKLADWLRKYT